MTSSQIKKEVIDHLIYQYNMDITNAQRVYNDADNLFPRVLTLTDLTVLRTIDQKILGSLLIFIREIFELSDIFK